MKRLPDEHLKKTFDIWSNGDVLLFTFRAEHIESTFYRVCIECGQPRNVTEISGGAEHLETLRVDWTLAIVLPPSPPPHAAFLITIFRCFTVFSLIFQKLSIGGSRCYNIYAAIRI